MESHRKLLAFQDPVSQPTAAHIRNLKIDAFYVLKITEHGIVRAL